MTTTFANRAAAGRALADRLVHFAHESGLIVLGLPRGGVPVAAEVAGALAAPLDVYVVRKLGVPGHTELAFGAIGPGGVRVLNDDVVHAYALSPEQIDTVVATETAELERRVGEYRGDSTPPQLGGQVVILVDDGLATGATMRAAVQAVRANSPRRVVVAVPVAAASTARDLESVADDVVCAQTPMSFVVVGQWYDDFSQTTDAEVRDLLRR
ncbi:MAG: phosphoribosyltransferase [Actinomycetes bacterium]